MKNSRIAHYGILAAFLFALLNSIKDIEVNSIIPFMPVALLGALVGCTAVLLQTIRTSIKQLKNPLFISINCFGLLALFSTIYSKYPHLTASRSLQFIIVTNCIYLMLSNVRDLEHLFEQVAKTTIFFVFIASLYGISLYHWGKVYSSNGIWVMGLNINGIELKQRIYGYRISSFLGNPNPFGMQLMIGILFSIYFLKKYKEKKYGLVIIIFLYALLLTGSRASVIGLVAGSAVFFNFAFLKNNYANSAFRLLLVCGGAIIAYTVISNPELVKKIFSLIGRDSNTLSGREIIWTALIEQFKNTPFFGIGYRVSTESVLHINQINAPHSHNLYLSILTEVGIVGYILFIFIFFMPIINLFINKYVVNKSTLLLSCHCILVAFLANQFFEEYFSPLTYYFISLLFILFFVYVYKTREKKQMCDQ